MLAVLWCWLKRNSHIILLVLVAFFLRAIPHLFMIPLLAIEEDVHWLFVYKLMNGNFSAVFSYPHSVHFLVGGIRIFFSLPAGIVESYINPILGALTIPCIIFFMKGLKNTTRLGEIVIGILLVCLDVHIYRSCVWQSTEILALNFLFLMLGCLVRQKMLSAFFFLLLETQTHYLSLIIGGIVFIMYGLILFKPKGKLILCLSMLGLGVSAYVFFPYTMSADRFLYTVECFNPTNVVILYSISDLLLGFVAFPLTIICLLCLLYFIWISKFTIVKIFNITVVGLAFLSTIFFNPLLIGPFRLVLYGAVMGCVCLTFLLIKLKTRMLILILSSLCLMSLLAVYPNGLYSIQLVDKVSTQEEIQAISYFVNHTDNFYIGNVATDLLNYGIFMYVTKYEEFSNPLLVGEEIQKRRLPVLQPPENWWQVEQVKYIFWSKRMERNAVFYGIENDTSRFFYEIEPVPDLWCNHVNFTLIYNEEGVKIYERINYDNK